MNVLIADDDAVSRYILRGVLQSLDYEVTVCENGSQAWEEYLRGDYHLVISDWMMPEVDGLELCRRIRKLNRQDYCYFILSTAHIEKEYLLKGIECGADNYLLKPFDGNDLKIRLKIAERVLALQSQVRLEKAVSTCPLCQEEEHIALHSHSHQA
jgi:CheY-like chemotaxis protein